jgi:tRNA modification GTPase
MSGTHVSVLTPPGSAAVAVLSVRGPHAWPVLHRLFRDSRGEPLAGPPSGFALGKLGEQAADEVILAAVGPDSFEVHCHGGTRVVTWLLDLFRRNGIPEPQAEAGGAVAALDLLPRARTVRTAGVLLDQVHGAYDRAEEAVRTGGPHAEAVRAVLRRNAQVGRHLVEPWSVAIAGAPNAGKSSLLNALAGFARSVVSPIPGTTRDAVRVSLAFDGWPVDLIDTAGLREAPDALESEGVERARAAAADSDLVLWVVDSTGPRPESARDLAGPLGIDEGKVLVVFNKTDLADIAPDEFPGAVRVSAVTGFGLPDLAARIVAALVPDPPAPGDPVPFTPERCDRWSPP